ncbi:Dehydrogenase [Lachnellula hyalina]|uniref:Dehydrogenase n=1 Tax=Lachnellula hyalina TaxID=1316788 RepID=A0A8H8U2L7_9HELO|nr:Dehydrogenase [Lachnellula hyalina]TVY29107.1 Dehydrogenase [Lachnellula hyalina]
MPSNTAAWLEKVGAIPLDVKSAPYTSPTEHQIVIKSKAVAINPADWAIQVKGNILFPWLAYPYIGGSDVAGEVYEIGSSVTRFKVGDRVIGLALCLSGGSEGAFQEYTVLRDHMTSHIPQGMSYESASAIPLGLSTAASGLFQKGLLGLQLPSISPKPTGKSLLIWGGSTSVGCNAIQLAVGAGYEVITTCSPKNFAYVKTLGASQAFDYNSPTIIPDLISAFAVTKKPLAGALAIAAKAPAKTLDKDPAMACVAVVAASDGANKFVACATFPPAEDELPEGVSAKFCMAGSIKDDEVGPAMFVDFLPKALEEGSFVAAPEAEVFGKGLESIQGAFDVQMKGVSAKKIVVSL